MPLNDFVCLTCGSSEPLDKNHPGNKRARDGIVFRGSCEKCRTLRRMIK